MIGCKRVTIFVSVILLTSCTTSMLWDATDPAEYVAVSMDEITEQDLKDKGLAYKVDEGRNVYYIEKGVLRKTRDYVYRSFATPVTVTVDVVTPLVVVGGLTYAIMNADGVGHIDFEEFYTWLSGTYDLD